jgi:peptidoglycan/xylan/chitin deacetylase (PgdA/CDA1 family)
LPRTLLAFAVVLLALSFLGSDAAVPAIGPSPGTLGATYAIADSSAPNGGTAFGAGEGPIGCTSTPGAEVEAGSPSGRKVALTFDDGPNSTQTPAILTTLESLHAHATFFEEGRHVSGREELMREILAAGDEIGNHSYDHPKYPGNAELASTDRRIRAATGFEPCLFRPPYGLVDGTVAAAARRNKLELVLWNLDSGDDHHQGAAMIQAHAVHRAQPGSIILMHDGGHHPQTPRALPGVIEGLRARGFRFVTVSALLGGRMLYRPGHGPA